MVWPLIAAAAVNAHMDKRAADAQRRERREQVARENARRRQEGAAGILQSNAASLGADTYNVQAAGVQHAEVARNTELRASERAADDAARRQKIQQIVNFAGKAYGSGGGGPAAGAGGGAPGKPGAPASNPYASDQGQIDGVQYGSASRADATGGQYNPLDGPGYDPRQGYQAPPEMPDNRAIYEEPYDPNYGGGGGELDEWLNKQKDPYYY